MIESRELVIASNQMTAIKNYMKEFLSPSNRERFRRLQENMGTIQNKLQSFSKKLIDPSEELLKMLQDWAALASDLSMEIQEKMSTKKRGERCRLAVDEMISRSTFLLEQSQMMLMALQQKQELFGARAFQDS